MNHYRTYLLAAVALAATLGGAADALACSCAAGSAREALRGSDAAVVAELVEVTVADEGNPAYGGDEQADFRYRIKHVYKGRHRLRRGQTLTIRSSVYGASCGLPQREARGYGLLLYRRAHRWGANLCTVISPRRLRDAAAHRGRARAGSSPEAKCLG